MAKAANEAEVVTTLKIIAEENADKELSAVRWS
jgi:hypothetical protein